MGYNKIELFRSRKGVSLSSLAREVGISRQSLYAIEAGGQIPKVYLAISIAKVLGVDVSDLFPQESQRPVRVDFHRGRPAKFRACLAEIDGVTIIRQSSSVGFAAPPAPADAVVCGSGSNFEIESELSRSSMFLDGCDPVLGIISTRISEGNGDFRVRWFYGSNKDSLLKLRSGLTHCALVHGEADEIRSEVGYSAEYVTVPFGRWELALCFLPTNPKRISSFDDLLTPGVRFAAREEGSGVRHFVDNFMVMTGIDSDQIEGTETFGDHYQVAAAVELGLCDAGVIPVSVAENQGLGYISVGTHQSSLIFSKNGYSLAVERGIFDLVNSALFGKEVAALGGYELFN
ncbi:MAG: helix-turn-helix domain-containing protein [Acidimicrobiaceae bacterium]|nr:helix-turn-helix domain-containing protein [Acidimicrobiaceae bacterium]